MPFGTSNLSETITKATNGNFTDLKRKLYGHIPVCNHASKCYHDGNSFVMEHCQDTFKLTNCQLGKSTYRLSKTLIVALLYPRGNVLTN